MADLEKRSLTKAQIAGAIVAGLVLAGLPLARFVFVSGHGAAHTDHRPWFGGQLAMAGDHHVELRRTPDGIEAFVSDAHRRPVEPREAWARLDGAAPVGLSIDGNRLHAPARDRPDEVETIVVLDDGTKIAITFDLSYED